MRCDVFLVCRDARIMWDTQTGRSKGYGELSSNLLWLDEAYLIRDMVSLLLN
jgi:hypothetical protein